MQPPRDDYQYSGNGYPPEQQGQQWTRQGGQWPQADPWAQQSGQGAQWAPQDDQWVQRPVPGQNAYDPYGQGQMPPPAQIMPDPAQQPMPYQGGYFAPQGGMDGQMNYAYGPEDEGQAPADSTAAAMDQRIPYQPPSTGLPRQTGRRARLWPLILLLAVIGVAVFAVVRMTSNRQASYGYVRFGALSALYTGDAVLVRSETVITEESVSQIEYVAKEGMQVERGTMVATIYKAGFSSKDQTTLQNYRNQIKEYQKTLIASATTDTTLLSVMTLVRTRAMEVQRLVQGAKGDLSTQETLLASAMQDQQITIKQKFPNDQKLSRLYDDENTQKQKIANWTKQCATTAKGIVSFYTDGYEKGLNMTTYADFTPAQVREMYNGKAPETVTARNSTDVYRLVRDESWAVLMLCHDTDWTPIEGRTYNLVIESFDSNILTATVDTFTRSGGELLVRLIVEDTSFLPNILYLRTCQVRIGENVNSLMVPSRAIYVQNGRKGVVLATEGGEYWTGVEVVSDDGTTAYVIPDNAGVLYEGVPVRLF